MKEKISVTLDSDLLRQADSMINGDSVKNRSQALESLLRDALSSRGVDTAVILAGGDESRLRHGSTFKPLARVEGSTVLDNTLRLLKSAGVTRVIIAAGPITEHVRRLAGDGSEYGLDIAYVEDTREGTAGALKSAEGYIKGPFFVVLGDIFFDFDLTRMVRFHRTSRALATIAVAVTELGDSRDWLKISGNRIVEFRYEPGRGRTYHVNAGIYLFEKDVLKRIHDRGSLERDTLPDLVRKGQLSGFVFSGKWKHIK
jgi:mannose-1-phosphate guanylyltransferase/phosphomannomutase